MIRSKVLLVMVVCLFSVQHLSSESLQSYSAMDLVDQSIASLNSIETDLKQLRYSMESLQNYMNLIESDLKASLEVSELQKALLANLKEQQGILKKRYEQLLTISQNLKKSLELSRTINAIALPVTIVSLSAAIILAITNKR